MAAVLNTSTDMSSNEPCKLAAVLYFDTLTDVLSIEPGLTARVRYKYPAAALPGTGEAQLLKGLLDALVTEVPIDRWGEE